MSKLLDLTPREDLERANEPGYWRRLPETEIQRSLRLGMEKLDQMSDREQFDFLVKSQSIPPDQAERLWDAFVAKQAAEGNGTAGGESNEAQPEGTTTTHSATSPAPQSSPQPLAS